MALFDLPILRRLSEEADNELNAQHQLEVHGLLPILGPIFGCVVILFNVWDHLIDPDRAFISLTIRVVLVLLGATAYFSTRLSWNAVQRCGFIYWTHVSAIILCVFLLKNGLIYGLSGICACIFIITVVTFRIKIFVLILSLPSILFLVLSALTTSALVLINSLMMYFFAIGLACIVMLVIRASRQKAFLFEKELLQRTRHDNLTGAYNRAYLAELAEREIALSKRHNRPLAVAMLDIDHFKKVNDSYGHHIGDLVICALANACKTELRVIDHFGRMGGEEFVALLPETSEIEAWQCAERLRKIIEELRVDTPKGQLQFTVSIGLAMLDAEHTDWSKILIGADNAMYRAKNEGRNRVVMSA
ncbi:MAG: GGDEF domain-containing protein [Burkholderiales bacterium]|nr:GGDEF domain-containing protein [Burkholderiales bacterium]